MIPYEKHEGERNEVRAQLNRRVMRPVSFEVFKKTDKEKGELLTMKSKWNESSLFGQTIRIGSFIDYKFVISCKRKKYKLKK